VGKSSNLQKHTPVAFLPGHHCGYVAQRKVRLTDSTAMFVVSAKFKIKLTAKPNFQTRQQTLLSLSGGVYTYVAGLP
jgi:hypothetical protein